MPYCILRRINVLRRRKDVPGGKPVAEGISWCDLYLHLLRRTAGANMFHCLGMTVLRIPNNVRVFLCTSYCLCDIRVGAVKTVWSLGERSTLSCWSRSATATAQPKWWVLGFLFLFHQHTFCLQFDALFNYTVYKISHLCFFLEYPLPNWVSPARYLGWRRGQSKQKRLKWIMCSPFPTQTDLRRNVCETINPLSALLHSYWLLQSLLLLLSQSAKPTWHHSDTVVIFIAFNWLCVHSGIWLAFIFLSFFNKENQTFPLLNTQCCQISVQYLKWAIFLTSVIKNKSLNYKCIFITAQ